jgi:hypothetical protein
METKARGSVKMTNAMVVWVWEAVSNSAPGAIEAANCLMPNKATINFQALSLNAPQNCAISRPRRGYYVESGPVLMDVVTLRLR